MLSSRSKRQATGEHSQSTGVVSGQGEVAGAGLVLMLCVFLSASTLFRPCVSLHRKSVCVADNFAMPHLMYSVAILLFKCMWMMPVKDNIS